MVEFDLKKCFLEHAKLHNYDSDDYFDLLQTSAEMAGWYDTKDHSEKFSKETLKHLLLDLTGDPVYTYQVAYVYDFFEGDNGINLTRKEQKLFFSKKIWKLLTVRKGLITWMGWL